MTEVCAICGHAESLHSSWWEGAEECQGCLHGEPRIMPVRERIAAMAACHPDRDLSRWESRTKAERDKWLLLAARIIAEMEAA